MSRKVLSALVASVLLSGIMAFVLLGGLASATLSAESAPSVERGDPHAFLSQFKGRQFPNEMPPADDWVVAKSVGFPVGSSADEANALMQAWYEDFKAKKDKSGPNPIAYARRMEALAKAEAQGLSPMAAGLAEVGTAKMLMIPIEFASTDVISVCDQAGGVFQYTQTITGPLNGTIPAPALSGDNYTIWTDTFSVDWYQDLMFGDGVGVVRTDLNGGAGVDLSGISAANWYLEQSEGGYTLTGEVYTAWVQLDHSVAWYGWDGDEQDPNGTGFPCDGTSSGNGFEFAIDAVNKLNQMDPDFDWSEYDVDGDGVVDHLMFIHAGVDNSAGGGTYGDYQLWAHSWDVYCDKGDGLTIGCVVDDNGTVTPTDDIMIANYTHIPEDADIGVVVHEYGHDIGLPDYYDTSGDTSNSTAHWIVMSGGSWSGILAGAQPAPFNPWARYFFGWEEPMRIDYDAAPATVRIGQSEPTPLDTEDSVWIDLPDQMVEVGNLAGDGKGLHTTLNNMSVVTLEHVFDLSVAAAPTFTFDTYFDIEEDWDYVYVRASTDGVSWTILFNDEGEYAMTDPNGSFAWLGEGGLTGNYGGSLTYDLISYTGESMVYLQFAHVTDQGTLNPGMWIDNLALPELGYANDLEDHSDWANNGWEEVPYSIAYPHYYMLEWRNDEGSIAQEGLNHQYYSLNHADDGWMVDQFSANVPGLVVWYRNNRYTNNQVVGSGRYFDPYATGPKGELLLVDSHYEPGAWSGGLWDPGAGDFAPRFSNRRGSMDGAFTLDTTPAWMIHDYAEVLSPTLDFGSKPAVSAFNDSLRSVPGWLFPNDGFVYRIDEASSVVIPGACDYSTRIRLLDVAETNPGDDLVAFWGFTVGGQVLGPGNPGDDYCQFGVNVELTDQAVDGTWGEISFHNQQPYELEYTPEEISMEGTYFFTYTATLNNVGTMPQDRWITFTLDSNLTFVSADWVTGTMLYPTYEWVGTVPTDTSLSFTLVASMTVGAAELMGTEIDTTLMHDNYVDPVMPESMITTIKQYTIYMPLVLRNAVGTVVVPTF
ncbi:MAG: M6 family metalloprotease domain-containing protein [Chloroflexi bacterium]|nr:M6 family metalloprotease domain-containing protein [Chloroflexota bacterium]